LNVLREQELLPVNVLAVMLVGSRARGWDNDKSDFDIYVVTDRIWTSDSSASRSIPLNPPVIGSETFYTSDERWEVTYWQDAQVGQILSKVSWAEFGREQAAGQVLSVGEEIFLDRLPHCRVLVGPAWVEARRTELATSAFRSFVVARSLSAADDSTEDALGLLEAGQLESSVLAARKALGHIVDALLEQCGEYGSHSPKWRPQRFGAANPAGFTFAEYWRLETMQDLDPDDPGRWVREVLTLCQDLSMKMEI